LLTNEQSAILSSGKDLLSFGGANYNNVIFSFHAYSEWSAGGAVKMADYIQRVQAEGLALMAGEYGGDKSMSVTQDLLAMADSYNLGRIAWNWQGDAGGGGYNLTTGGGGFLINDPLVPTNLSPFGQLVWADTHATDFSAVPLPSAVGTGSALLIGVGLFQAFRSRRRLT
jgi:hypothetical protein